MKIVANELPCLFHGTQTVPDEEKGFESMIVYLKCADFFISAGIISVINSACKAIFQHSEQKNLVF